MKKTILLLISSFLMAAAGLTAGAQEFTRRAEFSVNLEKEIVKERLVKAIDYLNADDEARYSEVLNSFIILGSIKNLILPMKKRSATFDNVRYSSLLTVNRQEDGGSTVILEITAVYPGDFKWYRFPTHEFCLHLPEHPEEKFRGKKAQALQALVAYMDRQFKRDCDIILRSLEFESDMELE